ncbi:MAG: histidine phosphatase family protein [Bryobacterales bacterium]
MTRLLFESHATSLDNEAALASGHFDVAISPAGEQQARELGERYRGREIDAVFCSDLQRSYRTAELAFDGRRVTIERDPRLRECDYGALTWRPRREVLAEPAARLDQPFPGGESYRQAAGRVKCFLLDAAARFDGQVILIIGHRATHCALEHWLKQRPLEEVLTAPWQWQPGWTYQLNPARLNWI